MGPEVLKIHTAILSVADKDASRGSRRGCLVLAWRRSLPGDCTDLSEAGISVRSLQEDMNLPTMASGRVKTLHAPLQAATLATRTSEHLAELEKMGVKPIDMVVCDFYPFESLMRKSGVAEEVMVENIDIGGPTMVALLRGTSNTWLWSLLQRVMIRSSRR